MSRAWGNGLHADDRTSATKRGPYGRGWHGPRPWDFKDPEKVKKMEPPAHLGEAIRRARLAAGLTQGDLVYAFKKHIPKKPPIKKDRWGHASYRQDAVVTPIGRTMLAMIETGKKPVIKRNWQIFLKALPDLSKVKVDENMRGWYGDATHKMELRPPPAPKLKPAKKKPARRRARR